MKGRSFRNVLLVAGLFVVGCGNADRKKAKEKNKEGVELMSAGRLTEAQQAFEEASKIYPDYATGHYNLGVVLEEQKKYAEAAAAFQEASRVVPDAALYHYRAGKVLYLHENFTTAEQHLTKAVELEPRMFRGHYYLGQVLLKLDRPKDAAQAFTTSATLNPRFGQPFIALGRLYYKWDKLKEAISVLTQGSEHARDKEDSSKLYYTLGLAYEEQGTEQGLRDAVVAYTKALDQQGSLTEALRQRGHAYAALGDKESAIADLEAFKDAVGKSGDALDLETTHRALFKLQRQTASAEDNGTTAE